MIDDPDTEAAVRTWARAEPSLSALLGGRVFFAFPAGEPALPLLTLSQVSGGFDPTTPVAFPRLTFDCWGRTKQEAATLRWTLVTALRRFSGVNLTPDVHCYGVDDIFVAWQPDNEARLARYVVDATFRVRAAVTA